MDLRLVHPIARPLPDVERTLLSPRFAARLAEGSLLARGEELSRNDEGSALERTAHFVVSGALPLLGRFGKVGWREVVHWNRSSHSGTFVVAPDLPARLAARVRCQGTYRLDDAPGGTLRVVEVSIELDVPLAKAEIEARIGSLLQALFDHEATVLGARG